MANLPINAKVAFVPKFCCAAGCKKVARYAEKLSDFWISKCDDHAFAGCELSVNKAIGQLKGTF